jgi:hypothetical protein
MGRQEWPPIFWESLIDRHCTLTRERLQTSLPFDIPGGTCRLGKAVAQPDVKVPVLIPARSITWGARLFEPGGEGAKQSLRFAAFPNPI